MPPDSYTDEVRSALRNAIADAPEKNASLCIEDRILMLLWISGFRVVPMEK